MKYRVSGLSSWASTSRVAGTPCSSTNTRWRLGNSQTRGPSRLETHTLRQASLCACVTASTTTTWAISTGSTAVCGPPAGLRQRRGCARHDDLPIDDHIVYKFTANRITTGHSCAQRWLRSTAHRHDTQESTAVLPAARGLRDSLQRLEQIYTRELSHTQLATELLRRRPALGFACAVERPAAAPPSRAWIGLNARPAPARALHTISKPPTKADAHRR